jgi:hypothetical protein
MVDSFEAGQHPLKTTNVIKAIHLSVQAWQAISEATITDCWHYPILLLRPSTLQRSADVTEVIAGVGGLINQSQQQRRIQSAVN